MSLDSGYLDYPRRRTGYDHGLYPYSSLFDRPKVDWGAGRLLAVPIVISAEWFPLMPEDKPFRAPGHMVTPYPDFRHYTARDYGNRIGIYRLLDALERRGLRASIALNSVLAARAAPLVRDIVQGGHEIIAHATDMNATIASGLDENDERRIITTSISTIEAATGRRPKGWLSIARSQSWNTPDILKEVGLTFCCDWVNDDLPYRFNNGLINLPLNHELSDRQILNVQQQSADSYVEQMMDAVDLLTMEARTHGGRMLALHLTPYIIALPYRIDAFERLLDRLLGMAGVWVAPAGDIISRWSEQNG